MEQLIINVKDKSKMPFLKQLLKHFDFLEVEERTSKKKALKKKEILDGIEEAVEFIKKYNNGEVKAKSIKQLLNEL